VLGLQIFQDTVAQSVGRLAPFVRMIAGPRQKIFFLRETPRNLIGPDERMF
jgi:hypothetical protein